jgi:hypothetical protein
VTDVIAVVLDAANIACKNRTKYEPEQWQFARVERVKEACLAIWPGAHVRAVIDASAELRLSDRRRADAAHAEGWLQTAPGDADDLVLDLAAKLGAPVVSKDNFRDARRNHPWLEDEDRVWTFTIAKGRDVVLRPRPMPPVSDKQVAEARRNKAHKAGLITVGVDEVWICTTESKQVCSRAGQQTEVKRVGGRQMCRFCSNPAREQIYTPLAVPALLLSVDGRARGRLTVPPEGLVIGRGSADRPEVTDVTAGLDDAARKRIGRYHLRIEVDDDGWPVVVHQSAAGYTFLNPRVGPDGLPLDNGLRQDERYPLIEGDTLWLDEGRVRLDVTAEEPQ